MTAPELDPLDVVNEMIVEKTAAVERLIIEIAALIEAKQAMEAV